MERWQWHRAATRAVSRGTTSDAGTDGGGGGSGGGSVGGSGVWEGRTDHTAALWRVSGEEERMVVFGGSTREGPSDALWEPMLICTPRGLPTVRTVCCAYQLPACCAYRRPGAACPRGPTHSTCTVRVPASGVPCVPCTVAPHGHHMGSFEGDNQRIAAPQVGARLLGRCTRRMVLEAQAAGGGGAPRAVAAPAHLARRRDCRRG